VNDTLVFALLFTAVACGWLLGRRGARGAVAAPPALPGQYYRGLNYLLDGRPDGAVDQFISALEVNSETFETHIALGNALRRRGEVDRAIRIHENLLARSDLPPPQAHLAHLELARDYISAGLLDRAEQLLLELVEESDAQRDVSRLHLIEIFRSESEWARAIDLARELLPRKSLLRSAADAQLPGQPVREQLAHFYCEHALQLMERGDVPAARQALGRALDSDRECVRASLLLGRLEMEAGDYRRAIKALREVTEQDADYLPEALPILRRCYEALGEERALTDYLRHCLDRHPSTPLMIAVADDLLREQGEVAARDFLASRLAEVPSLRGLLRLIRLQRAPASEDEGLGEGHGAAPAAQDAPASTLAMLELLLDRLIEERPVYRCEHCGFSAKHLLWFCPGCKYWGRFRTIRSVEQE
jgi:lipopolysaccharide biosynthesis regulator YciM